jgi:protease I
LIDAGGVSGKRVTSWPSLKEDLVNAGAHWMDEAVVEDTGLFTSRNPDDIPKFNAAMIAMFAAGPAPGIPLRDEPLIDERQ